MEQILKESACDYGTFIKEITVMVNEMMGEEYTARIYKVTKNNSLELDSLVLLKEGRNYAPNIYLLPYFEAYTEGVSMPELAERLCTIYRNYSAPDMGGNLTFAFETNKHNIIYRLVSYDKNSELLKTVPHIRYLDLAITYHCLVHDGEEGIGTIRITNEHLKIWNTSIKELHRLAVTNTRKIFPPMIRSMEDVINSLLTKEENYPDNGNIPEDLSLRSVLDQAEKGNQRMYILSNPKGINGATCLLYTNVLRKFSGLVQSDLYILPSSIHEVILIPYEMSITKEALMDMVKDVNRTQVAWDEVLSDSVYYYSRENNSLTL